MHSQDERLPCRLPCLGPQPSEEQDLSLEKKYQGGWQRAYGAWRPLKLDSPCIGFIEGHYLHNDSDALPALAVSAHQQDSKGVSYANIQQPRCPRPSPFRRPAPDQFHPPPPLHCISLLDCRTMERGSRRYVLLGFTAMLESAGPPCSSIRK